MVANEYKPNFYRLASFEKKAVYKPKKFFWFILSTVVFLLVLASFLNIEQYWEYIGSQGDELADLLGDLFNWSTIDFTTKNILGISFLDEIWTVLKDTIFNAFTGTLLGSLIAFPLAILASTNIIKFKPINYFVKGLLAIFRTLPIFLIALILLWFFPVANNREFILLISVSFFTIATISKLLYDKIEQTNMATFSLLEGIGVNKVQAFRKAVVPQLSRFMVTSFFYALEINVRYLSIIGFSLGLGFGSLIDNMFDFEKYHEVGFLVFVLIILVFIIEFLAWLTKKFIFADKDKVINLKETQTLSWTGKFLKLLPISLYGKLFRENSVNRFNLERFFFKKKVRFDYALAKINVFSQKQKFLSLKNNHQKYLQYLNTKFKLEKKLFKQKDSLKKAALLDQITQLNQQNQLLFQKYLVDQTYFENNFLKKEERFLSKEIMRATDLKFISDVTNNFLNQQTQALTTDYMILKQPYSWVKKTSFITLLLVLFLVLVSQIQATPYNSEMVDQSLRGLGQIFIPSWSTFFGVHTSAGVEIEFSAFELIIESVLIATMGTFFGFFIALILGALSSQTVTGKYLSKPFWLIATLIRPTPSYIYAILFIVVVPLGPFAGVLALTIATTGMLSKYIRETFDGINLKVVENLRAIGLNKFQIFQYGIFPQVSSEIVSWVLYRFDVNIREVATLGVVGAGNMGIWLNDYLSSREYNEFATLMYALIITSLIIEFIVSAARAKILNDKNLKIYDQIVYKWQKWTKPKYLLAYKKKGYLDANSQSWYVLKSDYLKTIKDLRDLKRTIKLSENEKKLKLDSGVLTSLTKQFDQDFVKQEIGEFVKEYDETIKINLKIQHQRLNSLKFMKAYAIYYKFMKENEELSTKIIHQIILDDAQQKMLTKTLKYQLMK